MDLKIKLNKLRQVIKGKSDVVVAFSGGVDSSLIAKVAREELADQAVAVTLDSEVHSKWELKMAKKIAAEIGIVHKVVTTSELGNREFTENPVDRCYHCKQEEIAEIKAIAKQFRFKTVAFGVNMSDFGEHRPGIRALQEEGFFFPLVEADIYKGEIAELAKMVGLSNYDLPSTTCLASRIPYGKTITAEKLKRIEEAESFLHSLGLKQVRVRHYESMARVEVYDSDIESLVRHREQVVSRLKEMGFKYVTLDMEGYRSGSMNAVLDN